MNTGKKYPVWLRCISYLISDNHEVQEIQFQDRGLLIFSLITYQQFDFITFGIQSFVILVTSLYILNKKDIQNRLKMEDVVMKL